jgi:hypothetical protein
MYGVKFQIKIDGWCLFHLEYLGKFIHWRFMNDNSWMLIHKIWILCSTVMSSSLYLLPNSTLPNGEVQVTIWLFCKIHFTLVVKFTLPNHRVNIVQLSSRCCQVSIPKVPITHQQGNIAKLWSSNSLCELPCKLNFNILVGTRDLRTLWSPPVSLNQMGHTQRRKASIFIFILFIFCDENLLKSPNKHHSGRLLWQSTGCWSIRGSLEISETNCSIDDGSCCAETDRERLQIHR